MMNIKKFVKYFLFLFLISLAAGFVFYGEYYYSKRPIEVQFTSREEALTRFKSLCLKFVLPLPVCLSANLLLQRFDLGLNLTKIWTPLTGIQKSLGLQADKGIAPVLAPVWGWVPRALSIVLVTSLLIAILYGVKTFWKEIITFVYTDFFSLIYGQIYGQRIADSMLERGRKYGQRLANNESGQKIRHDGMNFANMDRLLLQRIRHDDLDEYYINYPYRNMDKLLNRLPRIDVLYKKASFCDDSRLGIQSDWIKNLNFQSLCIFGIQSDNIENVLEGFVTSQSSDSMTSNKQGNTYNIYQPTYCYKRFSISRFLLDSFFYPINSIKVLSKNLFGRVAISKDLIENEQITADQFIRSLQIKMNLILFNDYIEKLSLKKLSGKQTMETVDNIESNSLYKLFNKETMEMMETVD
jgi:hypothetical protein